MTQSDVSDSTRDTGKERAKMDPPGFEPLCLTQTFKHSSVHRARLARALAALFLLTRPPTRTLMSQLHGDLEPA